MKTRRSPGFSFYIGTFRGKWPRVARWQSVTRRKVTFRGKWQRISKKAKIRRVCSALPQLPRHKTLCKSKNPPFIYIKLQLRLFLQQNQRKHEKKTADFWKNRFSLPRDGFSNFSCPCAASCTWPHPATFDHARKKDARI